mgnify:CR=1 FL=1
MSAKLPRSLSSLVCSGSPCISVAVVSLASMALPKGENTNGDIAQCHRLDIHIHTPPIPTSPTPSTPFSHSTHEHSMLTTQMHTTDTYIHKQQERRINHLPPAPLPPHPTLYSSISAPGCRHHHHHRTNSSPPSSSPSSGPPWLSSPIPSPRPTTRRRAPGFAFPAIRICVTR